MKRMPLALFLGLCITSASYTAESSEKIEILRFGWNIKNDTTQPLEVKWYSHTESTTAYLWTKRTNKTEVPKSKKTLAPKEELFFERPIASTTEEKFELILSHDPDLLRGTFYVDKKTGKLNPEVHHPSVEKQLLILSRNELEKITPSQSEDYAPTLSIEQPAGTKKLIVSTQTLPGWLFKNQEKEVLYARWFSARWDRGKRAFVDPEVVPNQSIITLLSNKKINIPLSDPRSNAQRQLIFSYNRNSLERSLSTQDLSSPEKGISARTKADLGSFKTEWFVNRDPDGIPIMHPLSDAINLVNTTNKSLWCSLYYKNGNDYSKAMRTPGGTRIEPQLSATLFYPKDKNVELIIVPQEKEQLLTKQKLTSKEVNGLYHRDFETTNYFNWYRHGQFAIVTDLTEKPGYRVVSLGGGLWEGLFGELLTKVGGDYGVVEGSFIEKFEDRFRKRDPAYLPNQAILGAVGTKPLKAVGNNNANRQANLTEEKKFITQRTEEVRKALNKLFSDDIRRGLTELIGPSDKVPKIALVFSGGGYRAMVETIGYLRGAAHEEGGNILDCAHYMAALSGSTWAVNPLVLSGLTPKEFSTLQRTKLRIEGTTTATRPLPTLVNLMSTLANSELYLERRFIESRYGQSHGLVGTFGHALAYVLLEGFAPNGKTVHSVTLSDLQAQLQTPQKYPFPLSVAMKTGEEKEKEEEKKQRLWYEFSPYYIGTYEENGGWVETKLFGSFFDKRTLVAAVPEYPLAQYLGIWGSAFSLSPDDIKASQPGVGTVVKGIAGLTSQATWAYNYLLSLHPPKYSCEVELIMGGEVPNSNFRDPNAGSWLNSSPKLCLKDGGHVKEDYRHNLATIPVLSRNVDVVIICDAPHSPETDTESKHLRASTNEALRLKLPFPNILNLSKHADALKASHTETVSFFEEAGAPRVVYMKGKNNKTYDTTVKGSWPQGFFPGKAAFTETTNFNYTPEQFDLLSGLTEAIFIQSKPTIKKAIKKSLIALDRSMEGRFKETG